MFAIALLLASASLAGTNKVAHKNEVPPTVRATATPDVGTITHLDHEGDIVYVAGTKGIAAIGPDGTAKWTLALPEAAMRNVDADASGVAFTSYRIAGLDPSQGFQKFVMGGLGDTPTFEDSTVGLVSPDGALVWSVASDVQAPLSAPGLSPSSVGVTRGVDFTAYDRANGAVMGSSDLKFVGQNSKFFAGFFAQATRAQPVVMGDAFYTAFIGYLLETDLSGKQLERDVGAGLAPYSDITCGPLPFQGHVAFGSSGDTQIRSYLFGADDRLKGWFKEPSPDTNSGCGAVAENGSMLFMASNFWVFGFDKKGHLAWKSVNKKGGLFPSSNRGVRYVHYFGVRKSYGELLVADADHVYVTADHDGDVVTVLDAATGEYVETLAVKAPIVGLELVGSDLAVATPTDVRFLSR